MLLPTLQDDDCNKLLPDLTTDCTTDHSTI